MAQHAVTVTIFLLEVQVPLAENYACKSAIGRSLSVRGLGSSPNRTGIDLGQPQGPSTIIASRDISEVHEGLANSSRLRLPCCYVWFGTRSWLCNSKSYVPVSRVTDRCQRKTPWFDSGSRKAAWKTGWHTQLGSTTIINHPKKQAVTFPTKSFGDAKHAFLSISWYILAYHGISSP